LRRPPKKQQRPPQRPATRDAAPERDLELTYGLRAGLALVAARPTSIVKIAYARELERELGEVLRAASARGLRTIAMSDAELARISGSSHHEGLCVAATPRAWLPAAKLADLLVEQRGVAIALDRVRNPYNVGAILRGAAFFGVDAALLGAPAPHPALAPDAIRVAEGGVEHLALSRTTDLADTLARLRSRGVRVYGADGAARESAIGFAFERPAILVVGHEREGLSPRVRAECDHLLAIRGAGAVESLNVAVATGILVSELLRSR
jgi:TrmH RNA methyltransferase